jgi:acyl-coenzyme A thioesterase PaaI-like protein
MLVQAGEASGLIVPPPVFIEFGGEFLDYDPERQWIKARFPVQERWLNPMYVVQGGVIVAAIDNTIGPLSYMVALPSATTSLEVKFLRPITPNMAYFNVEGWVEERTHNNLFMAAKAINVEGKTLVMCQATCQILQHTR